MKDLTLKRWLPFPLTSSTLFITWLLVSQSVEPAHLMLGALLAVALPLATRALQPLRDPRLRKPLVLFRLLGMALVEIVRSCFNVGRIILLSRPGAVNSQFIRVPLDLDNQYGLALLSCLINSTPGTVWVEILSEKHEMTLHVLDFKDEQWWIDTIKTKYEAPLIEIFGKEAIS